MEIQSKSVKTKYTDHFSSDVDEGESVSDATPRKCGVKEESKKRRMRFSYKEKIEILKELNTGPDILICSKYNLSDRTLRKWKAEKDVIEEAVKNPNLKNAKKKTDTQEMDDTLYQWVLKTQQSGIPVSGPMIKQQAIIVNKDLQKLPEFKASEGWLTSWKTRKNMRGLKITGEKLSADYLAAEEYLQEHKKIIATKQQCHRTTQCRTVVCIICESCYHQSDFDEKQGGKYVGEILVICPEHDQTKLTSKQKDIALNEDARAIIAQIKLRTSEEIKQDLLAELANKTQDLHNESLFDPDANFIKSENNLLRALNKEITEKNVLQQDMLETQKLLINKYKEAEAYKTSYADALINEPKPQPKRMPNIIVNVNTSKENGEKIDVKKSVIQHLVNEKTIKTRNAHVKNKLHEYMKVGDIEVRFLPPNLTSLIQPLDQGILRAFKLNYQIQLANAVLEAREIKLSSPNV